MAGPPDRILDFSQPFDVQLLDQVVEAFFSNPAANKPLEGLLTQFKQHPQSWSRVVQILSQSKHPQSRLLALSILFDAVKLRWWALPEQARKGIRSFLVHTIISMVKEGVPPPRMPELDKLNVVLVQVVRHEWPENWPSFVPELMQSSMTSEAMARNNMKILRMMSEEIFDFSAIDMTSERAKTLKEGLNAQFSLIFKLCEQVFDSSKDVPLINETLQALERFLHWIPVGYIFETKLIEVLVTRFFPTPVFQNAALQCLAEIGALSLKDKREYDKHFLHLFHAVCQHVSTMFTSDTDVAAVYRSGKPAAVAFVKLFANFLTGFLKAHLQLLESSGDGALKMLHVSLSFLLRITAVEDQNLLKLCLEYWNVLVADLYLTQKTSMPPHMQQMGAFGAPLAMPPRIKFYRDIMSQLRLVIISQMVRPVEVLVTLDEVGEEEERDENAMTETLAVYKTQRECLIYLTHLDPEDAQETMKAKLKRQVDLSEWSHQNLNRLCWAIGSISGALTEQAERNFLVTVIRQLLNLVELQNGKVNKAVVASNIMYVVGQYPRFLRQHWPFLHTVVVKLFEFMHERHPGVMEMSVETFLKIARKCHKKFVTPQEGSPRPFIYDIIDRLADTTKDLEPRHRHVFYEAVATIISAESDPALMQQQVAGLMTLPNQAWTQIIAMAQQSLDSLQDIKALRGVIQVLRTNISVANALGPAYIMQFSRMFIEMLRVYAALSTFLNRAVATQGPRVLQNLIERNMQTARRDTLRLVMVFVRVAGERDNQTVFEKFLPQLVEPVLEEYKHAAPALRVFEVLQLVTTIVERFRRQALPMIPKVFDTVFQSTLQMIGSDSTDFPDHRLHFFALLRAINRECFPAMLSLNQAQFRLVVDAVVWAIRHLQADVAETGLNTLLELLRNVQQSDVANAFYRMHLIGLLKDIMDVLTDTMHKPGFALHAQLLAHLFQVVDTNVITVPLWDAGQSFPNNRAYVSQYTMQLFVRSFPNLHPAQVERFVHGLFSLYNDSNSFKTMLRDFLIQIKEFSAKGNNKELYLEEQRAQQRTAEAEERKRVQAVEGLYYEEHKPSVQQMDDQGEL